MSQSTLSCACTFEYDSDAGVQHLEPCESCESKDWSVPFFWDIAEVEELLASAAAAEDSEIEEHCYLQAFVTLYRASGSDHECLRLAGALFRYLRTRPVFMATTPEIRDDIPAKLESFVSIGFPEEEADLMRLFLTAIQWRADYIVG